MKIKEKYPNIIQFEKQIHTSYKQFIGDRSLYLLRCYLQGFYDAFRFHENEDWGGPLNMESRGCFFRIFQRWMEEKYQCTLTVSLYSILRFHSDSEEDAFELYYKELDMLCEEEEEDIPICEFTGKGDDPEFIKTYGRIRIFGEEIEENPLKNEKYQNRFYQELWKMLIKTKRWPAMMIGAKSLSGINAWINGFSCAYHLADQNGPAYGIFPGFEEWVNQKARPHVKRPWYKVIMLFGLNEEGAFDLFYKYLEEYVEKID